MSVKKIFLGIFFLLSVASQAQDVSKALKVGDKAINFTLKNAKGEDVTLYSLLEKGNVIITWYRGGWCPYCNVALNQLQEKLPEFKSLNASLVALTPELPDHSLSTQEKNKLEFEVLTDLNNEVARLYGVVFKLDDKTANRYEQALHLSVRNGTDSSELPVPATYVIDKKGNIRYAYVNPDYKERANLEVIIQELRKIR
ncbi:peroxiredoxin-like family protein [Capnocytophaga stomatis]|uniref:peroxiredoxin-like family protein n=1 Tax=Capnocytophaga stomatis TaxID=1848904 RepID=UPI00385F4EEF